MNFNLSVVNYVPENLSLEDYNKIIRQYQFHLIVVKFSATWCPPCQRIKEAYHDLAKTYPNVIFIDIDVDENKELRQSFDFKTIPTTIYYKDNVKLDMLSSSNIELITEMIQKYNNKKIKFEEE